MIHMGSSWDILWFYSYKLRAFPTVGCFQKSLFFMVIHWTRTMNKYMWSATKSQKMLIISCDSLILLVMVRKYPLFLFSFMFLVTSFSLKQCLTLSNTPQS